MRYLIASTIAMAVIGVALRFSHQAALAEQDVRLALVRQQQTGSLPPELQRADIQTANLLELLGGDEIRLPTPLHQRLKIGRHLSAFAPLWMPLVVAGCLATAAAIGRLAKPKH
jgi:hypothetical protein